MNSYFYRKKLIFFITILASYFYGFVQDYVVTPQNSEIIGKPYIHDGDTVKVNDKKIRLYGIDAPELKQKCYADNKKVDCGIESKNKLVEIVADNEVFCSDLATDKYERTSGNCYFIATSGEKINIGQKLVSSGYALAYQTYSLRFVVNELYAKSKLLGVWKYKFQKPWLWRKAH
jgi:endonuclease YncB( thermonuclease family)